MKNILSFFILLIFCLYTTQIAFSQKVLNFEKDFEKASMSNFDSSQVDKILEDYFRLLTPFSQVNQLSTAIRGEKYLTFPLDNMRDRPLYKNNIQKLFHSGIPNNRLLSYLMISSSGDTTKRDILAERLMTESNPNCALWLGMGLMHIGFEKTSLIFKWVVKNNNQAGNFLFPMFMNLPADSLRNTAYQFVSSTDWSERIYAIQILMKTGYSVKSDTILREAIRSWPLHLKGYAIIPAQSIQIGNLLTLFKPLLDSTVTRKICLTALADSPTFEDRSFLVNLSRRNNSIEILESMRTSRYQDVLKQWLLKITWESVPKDYFFSVSQDTLLRKDEMLSSVHQSLREIKNPQILSQLIPVLKGRSDEESQNLLITYLRNDDSSVRYYATEALEGHCSERLKLVLSEIVKDTNLVTARTFDRIIDCQILSLQDDAERNYLSTNESITRLSALNYIATYPTAKYLPLFKKLITGNFDDNTSTLRTAAKGLAALNDTASIDAIIKASDVERKNSDSNCFMYLEALSILKGEKSKTYIDSFLNSENQYIKSIAEKYLRQW
jgi:hypothetical protein